VAGSVPEHIIQEIVRRADIVRLVGRYCELKKKGNSYWACCPFHQEKTASFKLDADSGLYHCFGCKAGGNVFTFLQQMDGLSFGEALAKLAAETGIDLAPYRDSSGPDRTEMGRLRQLNELATTYYQRCLQKAKGGEDARRYLAARHIEPGTVEAWRIGYAPEGWDNFLKCAAAREYEPQLVEKAGLAVPRQGAPGYYDRFRGRLMFPIDDATGRTIGFGARALTDQQEPKYLNSPETPLFSKGRSFFGLSRARDVIRSAGTAVVLEGYTDVIMAHQAGVSETLAVLGTALTQEHAGQVARLCERVILVFDADEAGQRSAARSVEVLLGQDIEIRVADLPSGQDPCQFIVERGAEAFRKRLEESVGFFEFRLALARQAHDTSTLEGRAAAFESLVPMARAIRSEARRDMTVRWLARELGVRESKAWAAVDGRRRAEPPARQSRARRAAAGRLSARQRLPRELLGMLLAHPEWIGEAVERLDLGALLDCPERAALKLLAEHCLGGHDADVERFLGSLSDPDLAAAAARARAEWHNLRQDVTDQSLRRRLEGYVEFLERSSIDVPAASAHTTTTPAGVDDAELKAYYLRRLKQHRKAGQRK
jgi:DNA primase